jgi:hypothetical protein
MFERENVVLKVNIFMAVIFQKNIPKARITSKSERKPSR